MQHDSYLIDYALLKMANASIKKRAFLARF